MRVMRPGPRSGQIRREGGLTLIELMVVMVISGLLMSATWRLFHASLRAYQRGMQTIRVTQAVRATLEAVQRDIERAFASNVVYGIQGKAQQYTSAAGTSVDVDQLVLLTMVSPTRDVATETKGPGGTLKRVRYVLEANEGSESFVLQRRVSEAGKDTTERVILFSKHLQALRVRYFDGTLWFDNWQHETLPVALEIAAAFQEDRRDGRPQRFVTVVSRY